MNPYQRAEAVYQSEPCGRTWEDDLLAHLHGGWVFSTPEVFVMGRCVPKGADPRLIVDPQVIFPLEVCDCWHIHVCAGDMAKAWDFLPRQLEWISFERKNDLRFVKLESMRQLMATASTT